MDVEGTGAEGVTDAPATVVDETSQGQPGYDKGDYLARVQHEPEFAVTQVREKDKLINEQSKKLKMFSGIEDYVQATGSSEALRQYVEFAARVKQNPQLATLVEESLRTGQVPGMTEAKPDDADDPYLDPEIKTLREQVRRLESSLGEHNQRFVQAETRSLKTGVESNVAAIMDRYGVNDGVREALGEVINRRVQDAQLRAERGDAQSLKLLESLAHPKEGIDTLRMIASSVIDEHMEAIVAARQSKATGAVKASSTGTPGSAASAGGGPPTKNPAPVGNWVQAILEKTIKESGGDPNKAFR